MTVKSTATGKREVAVRYGGIKLSEGRQQGAQGRAKVRKDVAVLERQDRLGNKGIYNIVYDCLKKKKGCCRG